MVPCQGVRGAGADRRSRSRARGIDHARRRPKAPSSFRGGAAGDTRAPSRRLRPRDSRWPDRSKIRTPSFFKAERSRGYLTGTARRRLRAQESKEGPGACDGRWDGSKPPTLDSSADVERCRVAGKGPHLRRRRPQTQAGPPSKGLVSRGGLQRVGHHGEGVLGGVALGHDVGLETVGNPLTSDVAGRVKDDAQRKLDRQRDICEASHCF